MSLDKILRPAEKAESIRSVESDTTDHKKAIKALKNGAVQRPKISPPTHEAMETAYAEGDVQAQIAILWEVVSGEELGTQ